MQLSLEGKAAVVTGGSAGIGRAIARLFAQSGARVLVTARHAERLASFVDELQQIRPGCAGFPADVASEDQVIELSRYAARHLGDIHILVNNAGIFPVTSFSEISVEEWSTVMGTNLDGAFLCARIFGREMIARQTHGRILNISSTSSLVARPGIAHYASSKAALNMLTRVLALEMAPHGITVNALCPGVIATETLMSQLNTSEHRAKLRRVPLRRLGTPEEVAQASLFLVSDAASYMTGALVVIDGGYSLGIPSYEE
jgi:NAD(P)-dependent dehydrogenase (short-subunit alcohol dehydrogenase family)